MSNRENQQQFKNILREDYHKVLEEEVAPLILNIEEESKHEHLVHHGDDVHYNHAAIQYHYPILFSNRIFSL